MLILAIETSCDETAVALYDTCSGLVGHSVLSQAAMFADYGGVVPELAARDHLRHLLPLCDALCQKHRLDIYAIDLIAYTQGPGLSGALLIGATLAQSLAFALHIPSLPIHHLEGHLLSPWLNTSIDVLRSKRFFPYLALMVSGGHSQLIIVRDAGRYEIIGDTKDDAAGEAFDKSAQLLGLAYPGGAALSALAERGDPQRFYLPRPLIHSKDFHFSFSGLKTAMLHLVQKHPQADEATRADMARAFVEAIVDVLSHKALAAAQHYGLQKIAIVGGVSANHQLRQALQGKGHEILLAPLEFCSDNAAMIALAAGLRCLYTPDFSPPRDYAIQVLPRWDIAQCWDYLH